MINFIKFKLHFFSMFFEEAEETIHAIFKPGWLRANADGDYSYVVDDEIVRESSRHFLEKQDSIVELLSEVYNIPVLKNLNKLKND